MDTNESAISTPSPLVSITRFGITTFNAAFDQKIDRKHPAMSWAQASDSLEKLDATKSHMNMNLASFQAAMNTAHPLEGPIDRAVDDHQSRLEGLAERIWFAVSPEDLAQAVEEYREPLDAAAAMWFARRHGKQSGES